MIGLYLKSEDDPAREELLSRIQAAVGRAIAPREIVTFTSTALGMSMLAPGGDAGRATCSWLCAWPHSSFDAVGFSPGLRPLRSAWSAALLDQANRTLRAGGTMAVPLHAGAEAKGWWTQAWLEQAIGGKPTSAAGEWATFRRGAGNQQASVLRWFFEDAGRLALDSLQAKLTLKERLADLMLAGDASPALVPQGWDPASFDGFLVESKDADAVIHAFNYAIGGVGYKAPMIRHIIATMMPKGRNLSVLDVGGGMGAVAAELLLTCDAVTQATCCDPFVPHLAISQRIAHRYPAQMGSAFRLAHATAEAMTYDRSHDVISFLGALLYVPREHTAATLRRAWERLNPNGLLIIHENIRNQAYARDFKYMFTVDELEGFLAEFGQVSYWLSTATVPTDRAQAGERSVFRVLRKA